jgi:hypothetical protein
MQINLSPANSVDSSDSREMLKVSKPDAAFRNWRSDGSGWYEDRRNKPWAGDMRTVKSTTKQ